MLFQNSPDDLFVWEILNLRQRNSGVIQPTFFTNTITPVSIETREPDLQVSAKIEDVNRMTLSVQVDHPELFQPNDDVMVLQRRSHETLVGKAKVLEITDKGWIYLGGIGMEHLIAVQPDDLLVKEAEIPSIVLSYVETEIPQYSRQEVKELRDDLRDDVINPPSYNIVRMPGHTPRGVSARHFPLPDSPVPMGQIVLPIGPEDGANIKAHQPGWMLRRIIAEDRAFQGRWQHWQQMQNVTELPRGQDIPYRQFEEPDPNTLERIKICLTLIHADWERSPQIGRETIEIFFDWLLWSLGHPSVPEFPVALRHSRAHDFLIQVFSVGRFILYPADYFGALLELTNYPDAALSKSDTRLLKSIFPGRRNDYRDMLLLDPQCGGGALMLAASNYTYQYQAVTGDPLIAKATILSAYFYVPWVIFPFSWLDTPDPTTTLTTTLMVMRQRGVDPQYFSQVQLVADYQRFLPVALVEPRIVNDLAGWLNDRQLPPAQSFELPGVMPTKRMEGGSDPLGLPGSPLPLPPPSRLPGLPSPGGDRLLPPSSDL